MDFVAHRGVPALRPENTKTSFELALQLGAKHIECDIQRTKDKQFVIFHDFTLNRTTNGTGRLREKKLDELLTLSAHNGMEEYFGERILTLDEFLRMMPDDVMLNLEVKRDIKEEEPWEIDFLRFVLQYRNTDSFLVSALYQPILENIFRENEDIKLVLGLDGYLFGFKDYLQKLPFRLYSYQPAAEYVNKRETDMLHSLGIKVYPWIINDKETFADMSECGVDGVLTDTLGSFTK